MESATVQAAEGIQSWVLQLLPFPEEPTPLDILLL